METKLDDRSIDFNAQPLDNIETRYVPIHTSTWCGVHYWSSTATFGPPAEEEYFQQRPSSLFDLQPMDGIELEDISERHDEYIYVRF